MWFVSAEFWADCEGKQQNDYPCFIFILLQLYNIYSSSSFSQVLPSHCILFFILIDHVLHLSFFLSLSPSLSHTHTSSSSLLHFLITVIFFHLMKSNLMNPNQGENIITQDPQICTCISHQNLLIPDEPSLERYKCSQTNSKTTSLTLGPTTRFPRAQTARRPNH